MLGVPGFAPRAHTPAWIGVFERITPAGAIEIARDVFGLDVLTVARLDTERDDSFRLRTPVRDLAMKVAHPADDPAIIDLQSKALLHAQSRDPGLPLPRLFETEDEEIAQILTDHDNRIARVFSWLPGTLLRDTVPDDAQLTLLGESLGRLSTALRGFEHHAAQYPLAWDLAQAQKLRTLSEREMVPTIIEALDRHESVVVPLMDELPRQVIHNDFNPGNVIVDPDDPDYVTGIIDFGDVIQSIRVADLAVALSYLLFPFGRSWAECAPFIEGFERRVLLLDNERQVLRTLVVARLAQRVLVNDWLDETDGNEPDRAYRAGVLAALESLLGGR